MRHKLRINWHQELKNDIKSKEEGFSHRNFKSSDLYTDILCWWDYPRRTFSRSWKDQSKRKHQWRS